MMTEEKYVAIYCRVSTEDQNVQQQANFCREWFISNGYAVAKLIKDTESGRLPLTKRRRFRKLLNESLTGKFNFFGIYNLDRLTRNWDDVTLIEKHFRENWDKCQLISTSDPIDLSNASGRFMFRIRMATSCFMPEDMREKQRIGIERARKQGKYKGGKPGRTWAKNSK
jgi:DNA invertase Pin-like site-specific DNA recombinase